MVNENAVSCDVVVLTALPVEFEAVCAHLTDRREIVHPDGTVYEAGAADRAAGKLVMGRRSLLFAVVEIGAGSAAASVEAARAIEYFGPRVVLFVGLAGGLKAVSVGDVVVASKVYGYESGRTGASFQARPDVARSSYRMEQAARSEARRKGWLRRLGPELPSSAPDVFVGPIASGDKVVVSSRSAIYHFIRKNYGDALAVEMEGRGFLEAASARPDVEALIVCGISDIIGPGNEAKTDRPQTLAARHAAAFAFELIANLALSGDMKGLRLKKEARRGARDESAVPSVWNVPHLRNRNFTGREEILRDLRASLVSGKTAALTQAIHGLGGVGKTQVVAEYAYRFQGDYDVVWWVRSEEGGMLASDYAALAQRVNLPQKDDPNRPLVCTAVRQWLRRNGGWLLIFDNVNRPEDIEQYIPQGGGGHVIVTSRHRSWGGVARPFSVQVWTREESITFLLKRTGRDDRENAGELADALGNLPLALEQAAAYMEESGCDMPAYLRLFQSLARDLLARGAPSTEYPASVATTWDMSFKAVRKRSRSAAELLNLCVFFAPDDIPLDIIRDGAEDLPRSLAAVITDELKLNDALAVLRSYSLVETDQGTLSIHRLVQAVIRAQLSEEETKTWSKSAVQIVNRAFPDTSDDARSWPECARLLPHALSSAGHAEELGVAPEATGRLLNQAGLYLKGRTEFREAKALYERALSVTEAALGADHLDVATILGNLGDVLHAVGDLPAARKNLERALAVDKKALGPRDPGVAADLSKLGAVLRAMGDLPRAKEHLERALAIDEKALGPDHPEVAAVLSSLGNVLHDMGDLPTARQLLERAAAIDQSSLGPDHPTLASDLSNLGAVMEAMGDLPAAREHLERALAIDEKALGLDHPALASFLSNLGAVLRGMGDLPAARKHLERALTIDEKAFGPDHPGVATRLSNLGVILQDMGDLPAARGNLERALAIDEKALGPDHPNVGTLLSNLGTILKDMGDLSAARKNLERALAIDERALGLDHPEVATDLNNLAGILQDTGDIPAAREHLERALAIDEKALGPHHPSVGIQLNNLGGVLRSMGEREQAIQYLERALNILSSSLGDDHPRVRHVRLNLQRAMEESG